MNDPIRMDSDQYRRVKQFARKMCANCDGDNCLLLDDGEACGCPQLITRSLICKYFRRAVLPSDPALYADVMGIHAQRRCQLCGAAIFSSSNAAKYCPACAASERRRRDAQRKRKPGVTLRK